MPRVIGITGGIGSGKSAVTAQLESLGIVVVDADLAARVVVEPGRPALKAIEEHFGTDVITPEGELDRAALRKIVFADESQRHWLEQLTHPLIGQEIRQQLENADSPYVVLSSPLLLETAQADLCELIVVVDVDEQTQLSRTMTRDNNDETQVRNIMAAQMSRQQRLEQADRVIDNNGSLESLQQQVEQLHRAFLALD